MSRPDRLILTNNQVITLFHKAIESDLLLSCYYKLRVINEKIFIYYIPDNDDWGDNASLTTPIFVKWKRSKNRLLFIPFLEGYEIIDVNEDLLSAMSNCLEFIGIEPEPFSFD